MRAITVRQPWASLITHAGKDIENRTWRTGYRGPLLIHAALTPDPTASVSAEDTTLLRAAGRMPLGAVIAVVDLIHICTLVMRPDPEDCACSRWALDGHYHWHLANARPLAEPVRCRGAQGLWTPPDAVLDQIAAQAVA